MVRTVVLVAAAIPAIMASIFAVALLSQPDIPYSAANPYDTIEIEYTKHDLQKVSHGITERTGSQKTQILLIRDDASLVYKVTEAGIPKPDIKDNLDEPSFKKLSAMIKETGFIAIPKESFPVRDDITQYQKHSVRIVLNGVENQIHWPEQNATDKFIPPIITTVESELNQIIDNIGE